MKKGDSRSSRKTRRTNNRYGGMPPMRGQLAVSAIFLAIFLTGWLIVRAVKWIFT